MKNSLWALLFFVLGSTVGCKNRSQSVPDEVSERSIHNPADNSPMETTAKVEATLQPKRAELLFYLGSEESVPGFKKWTDADGKDIFLEPKPALTLNHLDDVKIRTTKLTKESAEKLRAIVKDMPGVTVEEPKADEKVFDVVIKLPSDRSDAFKELTAKNVNRHLGVVLDGKLLMSPIIRDEVMGGTMVISLAKNADETEALSLAEHLAKLKKAH